MRNTTRLIGLAALVAASVSCGNVVRQGSSPVYLVVDLLQGIRGAAQLGTPGNPLLSDVITNVTSPDPCSATNPCPTIFNDLGTVTLRAPLKDPGSGAGSLAPTSNNEVTINRIHIEYLRADGRNTPGVDVPYGFDHAITGTIAAGGTLSLGFELVRSVAKQESPLVQLKQSSNIISAIAKLTFYGVDRVGNDVQATAQLQIEFGNFGDGF
jgi:hypothetical protein